MRIVGVDPGSIYTGIAVLDPDGDFSFHDEFESPLPVWSTINRQLEYSPLELVVVLEDFVGSGRHDAHMLRTIKIVGYIQWRCHEGQVPVELVKNQERLANVQNVPSFITGKDEIAAAAHALSYRERNPV